MPEKVSIDYGKIAGLAAKTVLPHGWKSLIPLYDTYKLLLEPLAQKVIESATISQGDDLKNIKEIIRSGKENGVDEMDIKISKTAGIDIGSDLSQLSIPCNVKFRVGAQGETVINVKYK